MSLSGTPSSREALSKFSQSGGDSRYGMIVGEIPLDWINCNVFRDLEQRGLW